MMMLNYVLMTEKSIQFIESENKLVFVVRKEANKKQIADEVKKTFELDVDSVNTMIDQKGRKKAYIRFKKPEVAGELAMRLGII